MASDRPDHRPWQKPNTHNKLHLWREIRLKSSPSFHRNLKTLRLPESLQTLKFNIVHAFNAQLSCQLIWMHISIPYHQEAFQSAIILSYPTLLVLGILTKFKIYFSCIAIYLINTLLFSMVNNNQFQTVRRASGSKALISP